MWIYQNNLFDRNKSNRMNYVNPADGRLWQEPTWWRWWGEMELYAWDEIFRSEGLTGDARHQARRVEGWKCWKSAARERICKNLSAYGWSATGRMSVCVWVRKRREKWKCANKRHVHRTSAKLHIYVAILNRHLCSCFVGRFEGLRKNYWMYFQIGGRMDNQSVTHPLDLGVDLDKGRK